MAEVPELWWSPTCGFIARGDDLVPFRGIGYGGGLTTWVGHLNALPEDARAVGELEPVDDKGRTPTYLRGEADGWNAARAGAQQHADGVVHEWIEVHLIGEPGHGAPRYDFTFRSDAKAWEHEPRLVQLARDTWTDVTVRTRHVRQVTCSTDWTERSAATPEAADA